MIYSKTFPIIVGQSYIEDSSFFGAIIYGVKRSGWGQNRVTGVPGNQEFSTIDAKILFDPTNPFNSGETVWVLYDKPSAIIPPACVIAGGTDSLPNAISGIAYYFTMPLSGTAPFTLSSVVKPAWMTITVNGSDLDFTGTPAGGDIGTNIPVSFHVDNCHVDPFIFSDLIDVQIPTGHGNFTVTNEVTVSGNTIKNIFPASPPFWTFYSGGLPVFIGQTALGYMTLDVTEQIGVFVTRTSSMPVLGLELYKNGIFVESIVFTLAGTYYFTLLNFDVADDMEIKLVIGL